MQFDTIYAVIAIIATYFSLRLPHMRHLPRGIDAHFHLLATSRFKKGRAPKTLGKFVVGDNYAHPPLLHFLLSLFPEQARPRILFILGATADCCIALLTYFFALQYVTEPYALIAAVIYSITPAPYLQSISESARPFGALWYSLSVVLLPQKGGLEMALATVTVALTLLSHKMATQTLVFTCLLMSPLLFIANSFFPLVLVLGFVLALLLTKGDYLTTLRDHVGYLRFHFKHGSWDRGRKRPDPPEKLAKFQPFFYIPLIGLLLSSQVFLKADLVLGWYISIMVIFLVWLWGDGYRYLVYSALPTSILSAHVIYAGVNVLVIIPALVVSALVIGKNLWNSLKLLVWPDFTRIHVPADSVTLVIPSSVGYISARNLDGRVLWGGANVESLIFELETLPKIMSTSPNKLLGEYPITHVLLGPKNQDFVEPIENSFERVLETNGYVLFKRK